MKPRPTNADAIEHALLDLAHTTDTKITAPTLAYYAHCTIEDAAAVLDDLAAHDRMAMDIEEDGTIVYRLYGRQKIETERPRALVPAVERPSHHGGSSPVIAAALTAVVPGAGHLYAGHVLAALVWFVCVGAAYALIVPGLVLHLFCMVSAAAAARRIEHRSTLQLTPGYDRR